MTGDGEMKLDHESKLPKQPDQIKDQSMSYDQYAALPEDADGIRYELVDGVLEAMSPSPSVKHQIISIQLPIKLSHHCIKDYLILGPTDLLISDREVRQPDLILIHRSRLSIITKRGIEGAPDLVVEILSPSSGKRDRISKTKTYASFGIPEYWIVDPFYQLLEQYTLGDNGSYGVPAIYSEDERVESTQLTCVSFTMNELMSEIPDLPDLE